MKREENGISLIVLVITIIILLILSGITIVVLTGDNGIIQEASQAKLNTEQSQIEEEINTMTIRSVDKYGDIDKDLLIDRLQTLPDDKQIDVTEDNIYVIYPDFSFGINLDSGNVTDVTKYLEISKNLNVGDYVNYIPQKDLTSYSIKESHSGASDQTINQEQFSWRILNISVGKVDLISTSKSNDRITLAGAIGYNNGVYILDDLCNKLYGNPSKNVTARNIKIEDIQDKMNLNVWDYNDYVNSSGVKYGDYYTYKNINYPLQLDRESYNLISYASQDEAFSKKDSLTVRNSMWKKVLTKDNFKSVKTRENDLDSEIYFNLLYYPSNDSHIWLSSRSVFAYESFPYFCIMQINSGVNYHFLMYASISNVSGFSYVLPIVSIPIDLIDINTSYDENQMWILK